MYGSSNNDNNATVAEPVDSGKDSEAKQAERHEDLVGDAREVLELIEGLDEPTRQRILSLPRLQDWPRPVRGPDLLFVMETLSDTFEEWRSRKIKALGGDFQEEWGEDKPIQSIQTVNVDEAAAIDCGDGFRILLGVPEACGFFRAIVVQAAPAQKNTAEWRGNASFGEGRVELTSTGQVASLPLCEIRPTPHRLEVHATCREVQVNGIGLAMGAVAPLYNGDVLMLGTRRCTVVSVREEHTREAAYRRFDPRLLEAVLKIGRYLKKGGKVDWSSVFLSKDALVKEDGDQRRLVESLAQLYTDCLGEEAFASRHFVFDRWEDCMDRVFEAVWLAYELSSGARAPTGRLWEGAFVESAAFLTMAIVADEQSKDALVKYAKAHGPIFPDGGGKPQRLQALRIKLHGGTRTENLAGYNGVKLAKFFSSNETGCLQIPLSDDFVSRDPVEVRQDGATGYWHVTCGAKNVLVNGIAVNGRCEIPLFHNVVMRVGLAEVTFMDETAEGRLLGRLKREDFLVLQALPDLGEMCSLARNGRDAGRKQSICREILRAMGWADESCMDAKKKLLSSLLKVSLAVPGERNKEQWTSRFFPRDEDASKKDEFKAPDLVRYVLFENPSDGTPRHVGGVCDLSLFADPEDYKKFCQNIRARPYNKSQCFLIEDLGHCGVCGAINKEFSFEWMSGLRVTEKGLGLWKAVSATVRPKNQLNEEDPLPDHVLNENVGCMICQKCTDTAIKMMGERRRNAGPKLTGNMTQQEYWIVDAVPEGLHAIATFKTKQGEAGGTRGIVRMRKPYCFLKTDDVEVNDLVLGMFSASRNNHDHRMSIAWGVEQEESVPVKARHAVLTIGLARFMAAILRNEGVWSLVRSHHLGSIWQ